MVLVAMVMFQSGASLAKQLFPVVGVPGTTTLRLVLAAAVLCAIARPWRVRLGSNHWRLILVFGAVIGCMNLLFYLSLSRIPLGIAVAIEFTGPLAVAFMTSRRATDVIWAVMALAGVLVLLPIRTSVSRVDPVGVVLALSAGVCWALYIVLGKRAGVAGLSSRLVTAIGLSVGAMIVAPVGVFYGGWQIFRLEVLPMAFLMAMLSSAIPYTLEIVALRHLPERNFGILMSLEPAVGAFAGLIFLGEHLTGIQWIAIGCVMIAAFGSSASVSATTATAALPESPA